MKEFDAIVVGAGSGLDIASVFASHGKNVALVEPGPLGGTCLNRGCIPSKMLIHRADIVETIRRSEKFHINAQVEEIDFENIVQEVNNSVSSDAEGIEKAVEKSENHTLYKEKARFVDEKVLKIGDERITADKIFLAAGSRPLIPPIEGITSIDYLTSKEALQLDEKPDSMVMIGGGYISCELAHFFEAMGVEVTIIEGGDSLLKREDREISEKFTEIAGRRFNVNLGMFASKVEELEDGIKVVAEDGGGNKHSFAGEKILLAAGRVPNTDELNVKAAGIKTSERGFIEVDEKMETNKDGIYAIGDIADNWMFKHSANYEAEIAIKNAFGKKEIADYRSMPHAVFSSPQIAGVGKTEQKLEEENVDYIKASYEYKNTGMGHALKEKDGFVKMLASQEGDILGCHIIGPDASQLIHEVLVAERNDLGVEGIKDTIHIHPALNEVVQRAFNQI
ncbi:dihydrolipoyl dehydrogenase [Candidatus Nanohalococcus occultus]|uniref:dihydrolipoyl dehydrogenase n=1 Tax=Candidatus Nanohalococcus occultus TaxID=2978047 RepID=UPI0039E0055A